MANTTDTTTIKSSSPNGIKLNLEYEEKICKLLDLNSNNQDDCVASIEPSGIGVLNHHYYIASDSSVNFIQIPFEENSYLPKKGGWIKLFNKSNSYGFEGVAVDETQDQIYMNIETFKISSNHLASAVIKVDQDSIANKESGLKLKDHLDILNVKKKFSKENKGYEGIALLTSSMKNKNNRPYKYLFAICESNYCSSDKHEEDGEIQGFGRIHVYRGDETSPGTFVWSEPLTIKLNDAFIPFTDYSGLDIYWTTKYQDQAFFYSGDVLITSQENKQVAYGKIELHESNLKEDFNFVDDKLGYGVKLPGRFQIGSFLSDSDDLTTSQYCDIEGIAWLGVPAQKKFVVVSDRYKKSKQKKYCNNKDQSLHIFSFTNQ